MNELLQKIDRQRKLFLNDNNILANMCQEAVDAGIYPAESKIGQSALTMVENYGAYWHQYRGVQECPNCRHDLRDHHNGPPFKLEIGIVENDMVKYFICPKCKGNING